MGYSGEGEGGIMYIYIYPIVSIVQYDSHEVRQAAGLEPDDDALVQQAELMLEEQAATEAAEVLLQVQQAVAQEDLEQARLGRPELLYISGLWIQLQWWIYAYMHKPSWISLKHVYA